MSSLSTKLNFNVPPATKFLLISLVASSALLQYLKYQKYNELLRSGENDIKSEYILIPYLQLIPNYTLSNPWTILTSIFVCANTPRFLVSVVIIFSAAKFAERAWSSKELIKFVLIVGSVSNLVNVVFLIVIGLAFSIDISNTPFDGNLSILTSFVVVFKQLIPEHSLKFFNGVVHVRVKHLPFISLVVLSLASIATRSPTIFLQAWSGFYISWFYLRFFQSNIIDPTLPQPNDVVGVQRLQGDASETFSLVHFFPDALSPILSIIFNKFYQVSVQLGLIKGFNESEIEQSNMVATRRLANVPPSDTRNAAERRRQVALRVLEERIGEEGDKKQESSNANAEQ